MGAVGAAILAANPHNTQPGLFHVTSSSVDVFADSGRGMPAVDPFDREHNVGMGCALENLVLCPERPWLSANSDIAARRGSTEIPTSAASSARASLTPSPKKATPPPVRR